MPVFRFLPLLAAASLVHPALAQPAEPTDQPAPEFQQVNRDGSVDLDTEYDTANLSIPREQIHTLLPRDAIPALTDPATETVEQARAWLGMDARVIVVTVNDDTIAVPLTILDFHEIANLTIGGEPVAATYCPLCDSATVISRRVNVTPDDPNADAHEEVLEFGVSGALFNSNVLMYDRTHLGLWSQLAMRAVSGPMAGASLDHLPVRIVPFGAFARDFPDAPVVSKDTGHERPYGGVAYERYFGSDDLLVPVFGTQTLRDDLPKKTLGLGVQAGDRAWFVTADALGDRFELQTPAGTLVARSDGSAIDVLAAPDGVFTAQTFYYAWASFHPHSEIVTADP